MKRNNLLFWIAASWCLLFCGCSLTKPRPEVHHYTLALHVPEATAGTAKATLVVRPFSAHDPYNQERLVYRSSPYLMDFYNYHRWAASPTEQMSDWARTYMRSSGLFALVYPTGEGIADFSLHGNIRQFDEIDHGETWEAALSLDIWLTRADQRTPLWFHTYTTTQQTAKRNPAAVAETMSRNLESILTQLISDIAPVVAASSTP